MFNIVVLLLFILVTVLLGYFLRFLTISGSVAAAVVGIFTALGLGLKGLLLLGLFFASSSLLSKFKKIHKKQVEDRHAKGSQRDWEQVVANGGVASAMSMAYAFHPDSLWVIAFCIVIASSNSDTWASEIGALSRNSPISIHTFKVVPKGTSGAMSLLGTNAAIVGSLVIASFSMYLFQLSLLSSFIIFISGFLGNIIDTIFGAYAQALYRCRECDTTTEKRTHCGLETQLLKGSHLLNNDVVNFLSGLIAVIIGIILYKL
ncbi:DUF92 domain-containing protein [Cytobacillus sp. FJAT-54145]|uniref:DUF92 domain-containing protein n=1 Tax=Cytobacillus spartinae TaxID=3299023 RepID=A0ABW6KGV2_9BACI